MLLFHTSDLAGRRALVWFDHADETDEQLIDEVGRALLCKDLKPELTIVKPTRALRHYERLLRNLLPGWAIEICHEWPSTVRVVAVTTESDPLAMPPVLPAVVEKKAPSKKRRTSATPAPQD